MWNSMWNWGHRRLGKDQARHWVEDEHGEGPLVLLESPDGAEAHAAWAELRRHGYKTMWCPGPGKDGECALTSTGRCDLVEKADAIVSHLDLHEPISQAVAHKLNEVANRTPVVVVAPRSSTKRWTDELPSCRVVAEPLSARVLVRSVANVGDKPMLAVG